MTSSRKVAFEGVGNARDMGGISIGGQQIIWRRLLRTASLSRITREDIEKLQKEYNPACVVDFRMKHEVEEKPDPEIFGAKCYSFPVLEPEDVPGYNPALLAANAKVKGDRVQRLIEATKGRPVDKRLYILFLLTERGKKAYRDFFSLLLNLPKDRGIVWHCKDGKDRTGIAAMLLLSALGASRDVIMEDYLLTNQQNEKLLRDLRIELDGVDIPEYQKERILFLSGGVDEEYMASALDWLDKNYGGARGYLESECMVDEAAIKKLKDHFLSE